MKFLNIEEISEFYTRTDNPVEIADSLKQEIVKLTGKDLRIGYIDLFNLTVRACRHLTFPYYRKEHDWRMRLHVLEAINAYLFTECEFDHVGIKQGLEGIGKSTLCLSEIDVLKKLGKEFDYKRHMITKSWTYKEVENLLSETKNSVIFFDEGKKFFDLRRSMAPERIDMLEFFTTERWRKNIYIMAVSDLTEIDKYFRERRAKSITLIPDRGMAFMLHSVNLFGVGQDRFYLERFENMINSDKNAFNFGRQISMVMSLPTCYGLGFTNAIDGAAWEEYFKLKIKPPEKKKKHEEDPDEYDNLENFFGKEGETDELPKME